MRVVYAEGVDEEVAEIISYLNEEYPRRGDRFRVALEKTIESIAEWPYLAQAIPDTLSTRRAVIQQRHLLLYKVYEEAKTILVIAVIAGRRGPEEMEKRIEH